MPAFTLPLDAPPDLLAVRALPDARLLSAQREVASELRRLEGWAALLAGETARRSAREFGMNGLSARTGARTPENLVQRLTGVLQREAAALVRVGSSPLAPIASAVAAGELSLAAADAIVTGLGDEGPAASAGDLATIAADLVASADSSTPERLGARARQVRAGLDAASVADRAADQYARRYLQLTAQPDGMTKLTGLLDPVSATKIRGVFDSVTSPRRGGPRFVGPDLKPLAAEIAEDTRTTGQLAHDSFVALVEASAAVDSSRLLPPGPAVKIVMTLADYHRHGIAFLQDSGEAIPASEAERAICDCGIQVALIDETGRTLDLGRTQRFHTPKQRALLALRDGGCRFPGCTRPPSWCEAHHRIPWSEGGGTSVDDGVLLCSHHHKLVHENGWRILRREGGFVIIPPPDIDPEQRPIPMPARGPAIPRALGGGSSGAPPGRCDIGAA